MGEHRPVHGGPELDKRQELGHLSSSALGPDSLLWFPGSQAFKLERNDMTGFPGLQLTNGSLWDFQPPYLHEPIVHNKSQLIN